MWPQGLCLALVVGLGLFCQGGRVSFPLTHRGTSACHQFRLLDICLHCVTDPRKGLGLEGRESLLLLGAEFAWVRVTMLKIFQLQSPLSWLFCWSEFF